MFDDDGDDSLDGDEPADAREDDDADDEDSGWVGEYVGDDSPDPSVSEGV